MKVMSIFIVVAMFPHLSVRDDVNTSYEEVKDLEGEHKECIVREQVGSKAEYLQVKVKEVVWLCLAVVHPPLWQ